MINDNMNRTESEAKNGVESEAQDDGQELKYESGDRVELPNGRRGTVTWSYMSLVEPTYDIDLEDGVMANQVAQSDIKGKVKEYRSTNNPYTTRQRLLDLIEDKNKVKDAINILKADRDLDNRDFIEMLEEKLEED